MSTEKSYYLMLKESQVRSLQRALLYQLDVVYYPLLENKSKETEQTLEIETEIKELKRLLKQLNEIAGELK